MMQRFGSILFGLAALTFGAVFVWHGIPHTTSLRCDRTSAGRIDCQKQEKVLWWVPIATVALTNLQSVHLGKAPNAYDGTVYFIGLRGDTRLSFGNTLDSAPVQTDVVKTQTFLQDRQQQVLVLERYEADWLFAILGTPIAILGVWSLFYQPIVEPQKSSS